MTTQNPDWSVMPPPAAAHPVPSQPTTPPAEHTTELVADCGMTAEQQIRAAAIAAAVRMSAERDFYHELTDARVLDAVIAVTALADQIAAYIADGSRP